MACTLGTRMVKSRHHAPPDMGAMVPRFPTRGVQRDLLCSGGLICEVSLLR